MVEGWSGQADPCRWYCDIVEVNGFDLVECLSKYVVEVQDCWCLIKVSDVQWRLKVRNLLMVTKCQGWMSEWVLPCWKTEVMLDTEARRIQECDGQKIVDVDWAEWGCWAPLELALRYKVISWCRKGGGLGLYRLSGLARALSHVMWLLSDVITMGDLRSLGKPFVVARWGR